MHVWCLNPICDNCDSMLLFLVDEHWRNGRTQGIDGWALVDSGVFGRCSFSER